MLSQARAVRLECDLAQAEVRIRVETATGPVPFRLVGLRGVDSPAEERRRFANTWNHRTWKLVNHGWVQDVPQLARMGWAELGKTTSLENASPTGHGHDEPKGPGQIGLAGDGLFATTHKRESQ